LYTKNTNPYNLPQTIKLDMLTLTGKATSTTLLPLTLAQAQEESKAIVSILSELSDVAKVTPQGGDRFFVRLAPVSTLGHSVEVLYVIEYVFENGMFTLKPLDFDLDSIPSEHHTFKAFTSGDIKLEPVSSDQTTIHLDFKVQVELPIKGPMHLIPKPLIQTTGDAVMKLKIENTVKELKSIFNTKRPTDPC
jgi:hypothetical protein